jgi:hypothetical protein
MSFVCVKCVSQTLSLALCIAAAGPKMTPLPQALPLGYGLIAIAVANYWSR